MQFRERDNILEVRETPGMHWILGGLFVTVGTVTLAGGIAGVDRSASWLVRMVATVLGVISLLAGAWVLVRSPRSSLRVDPRKGRIRLVRWGPLGRRVQEWPLHALSAVQLVESHDDEGGTVFQLHLLFDPDPPVAVSPIWRHGREHMEDVAHRLATGVRVALRSTIQGS